MLRTRHGAPTSSAAYDPRALSPPLILTSLRLCSDVPAVGGPARTLPTPARADHHCYADGNNRGRRDVSMGAIETTQSVTNGRRGLTSCHVTFPASRARQIIPLLVVHETANSRSAETCTRNCAQLARAVLGQHIWSGGASLFVSPFSPCLFSILSFPYLSLEVDSLKYS